MTLTLEPPTHSDPGHPDPTVIGLDTSLTATGIASSRGWTELVGYKPAHKNDRITQLPHRDRLSALRDIAARITLAVGQPDLVVLESPSFASKGGGGHERGWLWWDVYRRLTDRDIPIALLAPSQRMLYATGKGAATKAAVIDAVARRWPDWHTGGNDNLADATVLMAAGRDHLGHPITDMPKTHRAALDKVTWPETAVTR